VIAAIKYELGTIFTISCTSTPLFGFWSPNITVVLSKFCGCSKP
jgi:hypothetical protein